MLSMYRRRQAAANFPVPDICRRRRRSRYSVAIKRTNSQSFVARSPVTAPLFYGHPYICRLCAHPERRGGASAENFDTPLTSSSRTGAANGRSLPLRRARRALALMTGPACDPPFSLRYYSNRYAAVIQVMSLFPGTARAPPHILLSSRTYWRGKEVHP